LQQLVYKIKDTHSSHHRLINNKLHLKTEFGVQHFAGPVIYNAFEFVERNSDKLPEDLLRLVTKSSNLLLAMEFTELLGKHDISEKSQKAKQFTVMERFRSQLRGLIADMSVSRVRYIRCIKPTDANITAGVIDQQTVLRQLTCAGIITAIELTKETYPDKLCFGNLKQRFKCLLTARQESQMLDMQPEEACQFMMSALYSPHIKKFRSSDFTMPFAVGKTKVYYRAGALEVLEGQRSDYFFRQATIIQAWLRGALVTKKVTHKQRAVVAVQAFIRMTIKRATFISEKCAAIAIQTASRRRTAKALFRQAKVAYARKQAAIRVQSVCRMWIEECNYGRLLAAIAIQRIYRMQAQRNAFLRKKNLAECLGVAWKRHKLRTRANCKGQAATIIASFCRARIARKRSRATVLIQSVIRQWVARDHLLIMKGAVYAIENWWVQTKEKQKRIPQIVSLTSGRSLRAGAATKIQATYRMLRTIIGVRFMLKQKRRIDAAKRIQLTARQHITRMSDERIRRQKRRVFAAIQVQCAIRSLLAKQRMELIKMRNAKTWLGATGRTRQAAATKIQALVRGFLAKTFPRALRSKPTHTSAAIKGDLKSEEPQNIDERPCSLTSTEECARFVHIECNLNEERLTRDIEQYKANISSLKQEIRQITESAELHAQEMEDDFDDRISGYEEEVLSLKETIARLNQEKRDQRAAMEKAEENYVKNVKRLQNELKKIQGGHRDYLDKIMALLDDTEAAQKHELSRILEELELVKRDRDSKISSLKQEIQLLRTIGIGSIKESSRSERAQKLSSKLYACLAPDKLVLLFKEAQQQQELSTVAYIEDHISLKARRMISYLEEIVSLAEFEAMEKSKVLADAEQKLNALQQQLVCAYEEIEYSRLNNDGAIVAYQY
jgi:hypothetical protein